MCACASREESATEIASAEREELVQRLARLRMPQHLLMKRGPPPLPAHTQGKKKQNIGILKGILRPSGDSNNTT